MTEGIRDAVRRFIVDRVMVEAGGTAFDDETHLKEAGILDSFSLLNLVSFIEEQFELQLEASDLESGDLFSLARIESLVQLRRRGETNLTTPNTPISQEPGSRSSVARPFVPPGLYDYFRAIARSHADNMAVTDGSTALTYAELLTLVDGLADALSTAGVKHGDKAALILGNNVSFLLAILAAWKCGVIVIPLSPLFQDEEILASCLDSRPEILFTSTKKERLSAFLAARGATIRHQCLFSTPAGDWALSPESAGPPAGSLPAQYAQVEPDWPALTQYSTGSTGTPKRVTRTHGQLVGEFVAILSVFEIGPEDRVLGMVPFFHSHGLKNAALLPILAGAALYPLDTFFPRQVAQLVARAQITVVPGVPFMFQQLAELRERYDFSTVRLAFSGSAPLSSRTAQAFEAAFGIKLRRVYGATETGLISMEREPGVFDELNRAGHPVPGVRVEIIDEDGHALPPGHDGRVKVTSPFAPSQYDRCDANSASYFADGSYFPGDIGRILGTGELVLMGRDQRSINVGGNKVDAAEVENAILELPGVSEAFVFGVSDATYGERVKAVVVSATGLTSHDVRAHLVTRLAEFKQPRIIEFRTELPRTPLGKVQKKALTQSAQDR